MRLGAQSVVLELEYFDKDFSTEFTGFYSKLFRPYRKTCTRLHFFTGDAHSAVSPDNAVNVAQDLENPDKVGRYLGYVVVRPIPEAPVGRSVLAAPEDLGVSASHTVRADHEVHLLGAKLKIVGTPFMQQDARVSLCAHAAIWSCARHLHAEHRGAWVSVLDIARTASNPVDNSRASDLRAGIGAMSTGSLLTALHSIDRTPYVYAKKEGGSWTGGATAAEIISRYCDSGIPVILDIQTKPEHPIGHALVVVGYGHGPGKVERSGDTVAQFHEYFLVHDDQRGPYLKMPLEPLPPGSSRRGVVPFDIKTHLRQILVPLPERVYVTPERAELLARDLLSKYPEAWKGLAKDHPEETTGSRSTADKFAEAVEQGGVLARTYLTHGWRHKKRLAASCIGAKAKAVALKQTLPRLVWVTEFVTARSYAAPDPDHRLVFAHAVIDATAVRTAGAQLFFHAPGMAKRWVYNVDGGTMDQTYPVANDAPYTLRVHKAR